MPLIPTTHPHVSATLRAAGFTPHRRTRRESRDGFRVSKCSAAVVCMEWMDHSDTGNRAERFEACITALEAAGFVLCGNPSGRRVWDRDEALAIGKRCGIIGIARRK